LCADETSTAAFYALKIRKRIGIDKTSGEVVRDAIFFGGKASSNCIFGFVVPMQCPLVLLVKAMNMAAVHAFTIIINQFLPHRKRRASKPVNVGKENKPWLLRATYRAHPVIRSQWQ
jgi:hypothetical protein